MHLEFSRLRWPEWTIGIGGAVLLIAMVALPWYALLLVTPPPGPKYFSTRSVDGWNGLSHARWLMLLTILAAFVLVFVQARQRGPALPIAFTLLAALLAALTLIWLIVRVWIVPPGGRDIGGWIGLLGAGLIVYGGYWSIRTEGIAVTDAPIEIPVVRLGHEGRAGGEGAT
jgi:hypothetical protein